MNSSDSIRNEKIKKVKLIKEEGFDTYPRSFDRDWSVKKIRDEFAKKIDAGDHTDQTVSVAGRITSVRAMGKVVFVDLRDEDSNIQLYIKAEGLAEDSFPTANLDTGDIIGATGLVCKTQRGELSIVVSKLTLLVKSLTGLVDEYYGLKDVELRYRNRSLDLITNPESYKKLQNRFILTQIIRSFMQKNGFLEVETPITQPFYGGALAQPFITHHKKLDLDLYLRVSPEQYLKRLLVGGFTAVYEIGKCFRNENIDRTHNPEFTMLEAYIAYKDYNFMMDLVEKIVVDASTQLFGTTKIKSEDQEIDFGSPWPKITVKEALKKFANIDVDSLSDEDLFALVEKTGKEFRQKVRGVAILILFEEHCEAKLIQPCHIIDYPKESTVFCKAHADDPDLVERFESYVLGKEITNGYSELNDAQLQRDLLTKQTQLKDSGAEETWGNLDEEFLSAMDIGMPPAGGVGIGIDRLAMVLLDAPSIRDIVFFPTMKPLDSKEIEE